MTSKELSNLKKTYTGQTIAVEAVRPELARWANVPGRVVTINGNGRALVQFEGADQGFYDIDPDYLELAEKPADELKIANLKPITENR